MSKRVKTVEGEAKIPTRELPAEECWDVYSVIRGVWELYDSYSSEAAASRAATAQRNDYPGAVCIVHFTLPAVTI